MALSGHPCKANFKVMQRAPSISSHYVFSVVWRGYRRLIRPHGQSLSRGFDFTVFFEQLFLSTVPSAIFLVTLSFRVYMLYKESHNVDGGRLLPSKIVSHLYLFEHNNIKRGLPIGCPDNKCHPSALFPGSRDHIASILRPY